MVCPPMLLLRKMNPRSGAELFPSPVREAGACACYKGYIWLCLHSFKRSVVRRSQGSAAHQNLESSLCMLFGGAVIFPGLVANCKFGFRVMHTFNSLGLASSYAKSPKIGGGGDRICPYFWGGSSNAATLAFISRGLAAHVRSLGGGGGGLH